MKDNDVVSGSTIVIPGSNWSSISVKELKLKSDKSHELDTDGAIRKRDMTHLIDRDLQSAGNAWLDAGTSATLDGSKGVGNWNQFDANKNLDGYKHVEFDENYYTKKLDKSQLSREQQANADRIAAQIEGSTSSNIHQREERGQVLEGGENDGDEEARFSGVMGTGGFKDKSTPEDGPWKRNTKLGGKDSKQNNKGSNNKDGKDKGENSTHNKNKEKEKDELANGAPPGLPPGLPSSPTATEEKKEEDKKPVKLSAAAKEFVPNAAAAPFIPQQQQMPPMPMNDGSGGSFGYPQQVPGMHPAMMMQMGPNGPIPMQMPMQFIQTGPPMINLPPNQGQMVQQMPQNGFPQDMGVDPYMQAYAQQHAIYPPYQQQYRNNGGGGGRGHPGRGGS